MTQVCVGDVVRHVARVDVSWHLIYDYNVYILYSYVM